LEKPTKTTEVTITPQMAKLLLKNHNNINRALSKTKVKQYAKEILAGTFEGTAATVHTNTNGDIENGQHTLSAIVEANKPVVVCVKTGVFPGYGQYVDVGKQRSLEDAVTMEMRRNKNIINLSYVKQLTSDSDRLMSGLHPKEASKKTSLSDKIDFVLKHENDFMPLIKIFEENSFRTVGKTNQTVNKPVFRAPFQYFLTGYHQNINKNDVVDLAKGWLAGEFKGKHPMNKFDLWYTSYAKAIAVAGGNINTFAVYSMLLAAVSLVLEEGSTGVQNLVGWTKEDQFGSVWHGQNPPSR
jgi:hypothetical protein